MMAPALRTCLWTVLLALTAAPSALAADASPWDGDARASVRLIAGTATPEAATLRAGIEVKLKPGWKTYWRYPGDSGVPPRFDFAQSSNVKSVDVLWPMPHRIADAEGQTIGYKESVIFPLRVERQDTSKPVTLKLKIDYAICERLCVPAEGNAELVLAGGPSQLDAVLAAAEASVPKPVALNQGASFAIRSVRRVTDAGKPRVIVDVMAPEHFAVDLFAEGPTPEWALPLPMPVPGAPAGDRRFAFALDGLPPGASADGAMLTLTATAGSEAIEAKARLD